MGAARTSYATIAGACTIVAGCTALIGGVVLLMLGLIGSGAMRMGPDDGANRFAFIPWVFFAARALMLLGAGGLAVSGGISGLRRKSWGLLVVGSAAALFCFLPLGVAALVFAVMAEKEFGHAAPAPPPPG